jgi:two-component system, NtrC family, sensor histidine kinase HydH
VVSKADGSSIGTGGLEGPSPTGAVRKAADWRVDVAAVAGSLVHEIKNPLSTLNINAQLLLEDWKDAREPRELRTVKRLKVMQGELGRLQGIVESFLRFTERHELRLREGQLNDVIGELIEFIGPDAVKKNIQVRARLDPDLEPFSFDRDLMKQVLLNLVLNAEQALEPRGGGELILISRREEGPDGRWGVFDCIDTGIGIPERVREKLFSLYFSTKPNGSGLGLATSKRIVEEHGGSIEVRSEPGKGSQFTIRLPLENFTAGLRDGETRSD